MINELRKSIFTSLLGGAVLLASVSCLSAQRDEEMAQVFNWTLEIAAPDTSFIPLEGASGWEEPATQANIVCFAVPTPFDRMVNDLDALHSEEGQQVLEKSTVTFGNIQGTLFLMELAPVAGADMETSYSLMYVQPFESATLVANAQYPKSQHERLYAKMLAAFATLRKKTE